jgi:hypothetical protein
MFLCASPATPWLTLVQTMTKSGASHSTNRTMMADQLSDVDLETKVGMPKFSYRVALLTLAHQAPHVV